MTETIFLRTLTGSGTLVELHYSSTAEAGFGNLSIAGQELMNINPFCISSYLAFRYVVDPDQSWLPDVRPTYPKVEESQQVAVGSAKEILASLRDTIGRRESHEKTGIFLSGGIDSAIIAALLPVGTKAYTINFIADSGAREINFSRKYAEVHGLDLTSIDVTWQDYVNYEEHLMASKKAPLHPVEVALFKAAQKAHQDGLTSVFVGNGADSTFGGMDKLLSREWTFEEFVERYTFINPEKILEDPVDLRSVYRRYRTSTGVDVLSFLKYVHGAGIIQAFNNSVHAAGIELIEPFEKMKLKGHLDIERIRGGEPKYYLVELFRRLYPDIDPPRKIPFARPMDEWLSDYAGPTANVFKDDLDMSGFSGDQKYLIRSLDGFLSYLEKENICR
ncbi:MAG: asparagine synthase C-terminal domain-containing protein [Deltaproteobacteria bacterium]